MAPDSFGNHNGQAVGSTTHIVS
ncbi:uncharacterized protein G2W53_006276 [Senna tora]|uniref:Uncharacterized protein n=1 Tax=Senna tora TaxID=362788 RepID=A0A835CCU4_9FABA|nr:uncharacterized protein G2W53_006276 [Senna tora]